MSRSALATVAILTLAACSSAVDSAAEGATESEQVAVVAPAAGADDQTEAVAASDAPDDVPASEVSDAIDPATTADRSESDRALAVDPPDPPLEAVWTDSGAMTQRAQEFLLELGFWLEQPSGEYGVSTQQAVMAFQKYYGLDTDGKLGPQTAAAMNVVTERPTGRSTGGTLVEVDKSKQLVFIVRDGTTEWVLNTSTGSEVPYREPDQNTPGEFIEDDSITRPGVFAVNREREEGWWEGDLGEIYRPKYFDGGIALHGSYSIPAYPASHGCVRLSIQAMDWIWEEDIVPKGTTVWVHGEIPTKDDVEA
jgi:lipoprotein-anchoring transpeptidase ErfK/SrfK